MKRGAMNVVVGVLLSCGVGIFVFFQTQMNTIPQVPSSTQNTTYPSQNQNDSPLGQQGQNTNPGGTNNNSQSTQTGNARTITHAEVAQHNSINSCWSSINGNVYDLTSWIPQHPGGEQAILSICGIDGSGAFNAMHGGMQRQATILAGFKIGTLAP